MTENKSNELKASYPRRNELKVFYHGREVGTLAATPEHLTAFSYSPSWLESGFSISPFSLPLHEGVFVPQKDTFEGLFGIFHDSLPDAWGNLLLRRALEKARIEKDSVTVLDRLSIVGSSGRGSLEYRPASQILLKSDFSATNQETSIAPAPETSAALNPEQTSDSVRNHVSTSSGNASHTLSREQADEISAACEEILEYHGDAAGLPNELDELYHRGGSSGGTRPKINLRYGNADWILKFPAHNDPSSIGLEEYEYAECARACGIIFPETHLFPSSKCEGYFAIKRFDRRSDTGQKIHMATAAALLEADPDIPSLDYRDLMKLTSILSGNNLQDLEQMYLRMCFNFAAHNMDDHAANFTWLYNEESDTWRLSPAYDLTYSTTYYGEHTTAADGNGLNPPDETLIRIGTDSGLSKKWCREKLAFVKSTVSRMLKRWLIS